MSSQIPIINSASDSLKDQFKAFYHTFKNLSFRPIEFDLANCSWIRPLMILGISACIREYNCSFRQPTDELVQEYLRRIYFPHGINTAEDVDVSSYNSPIGFIQRRDVKKREALENKFYLLIQRWAGDVLGISNALLYPLSELVENIFEHSQRDYGWIFAQYYPRKEKSLEICIIDTGRGIARAYSDVGRMFISDRDAIERALKGESTKSKERGFGIRTSKEIVCHALKGEFLLITGSAALYGSREKQVIINLPGFSWKGVIISYRIPYPKESVDIYKVLE